jgi:hypothetical protein
MQNIFTISTILGFLLGGSGLKWCLACCSNGIITGQTFAIVPHFALALYSFLHSHWTISWYTQVRFNSWTMKLITNKGQLCGLIILRWSQRTTEEITIAIWLLCRILPILWWRNISTMAVNPPHSDFINVWWIFTIPLSGAIEITFLHSVVSGSRFSHYLVAGTSCH